MGGLVGILAWVSGAVDNAIYPTLFMGYVTSVMGWDKDTFGTLERFVSVAAITVCLAMLNYTGLEFVGNSSLVICVIAMSPFLIMTILGAPKVVPSRWFQLPESAEKSYDLFDDDFQTGPGPLPLLTVGGILWRPFLNNMFWNLNGFDKAGSFAGETTSASTTYPRGIFIGGVMTVFGYLVPLLVTLGATDCSQAEWVDGRLGTVAVDIGGKWLGAWMIFAAGISNIAMFEAEMSSDAFKIMGMAERGYLPKCFEARSKYGTPTAGILTNTIVIIAFSCADFGQLLELLNCTYAISVLLEYAAFVKLRLYHKELQRPYRIPIPDWASILLVFPPSLGIICIFATSNWWVYAFSTGAVLFSYTLSKLSGLSKRQGLFAPFPPQKSHEGIRR
jgi:amino acid transporter